MNIATCWHPAGRMRPALAADRKPHVYCPRENPHTTIQGEQVNVSQELEQLADFFSASASEVGISIAVQAESSVTGSWIATCFSGAVNLIENAIKYSPSGSTIDLSARVVDKSLQVDVADSGRGISSEHLPRGLIASIASIKPAPRRRAGSVWGWPSCRPSPSCTRERLRFKVRWAWALG